LNIAIIVSDFNEKITSRMLQVARERAKRSGIEIVHISHVPGAYDAPLAAETLLRHDRVDALVVLGAIIRGQTKHDEVIAHTVSRTLTKLSLKHDKPISLGITGPGMSERQAYARIRPVAQRAVDAASRMCAELENIDSAMTQEEKTS